MIDPTVKYVFDGLMTLVVVGLLFWWTSSE